MINKIKKLLYLNSYKLRNNIKQYNNFITKGGGNRKLKIEFNNNIYVFEESEIDDNYFILYSIDENPNDCVTVIISKEDKTAEIHGIGNINNCIRYTNENIGSLLLKITIKMLEKYHKQLNIKKIILTDNSIKKCKKVDIILSIFLILLTGDTWYGKYGFEPQDKTLRDKYKKNKEIMSKLTISDIDLIKYIKLTKDDTIIKNTIKIINKNPQMLLKNYLQNFMKTYDNMCKYFYKFYKILFNDIGLYNFYQLSFTKKLI